MDTQSDSYLQMEPLDDTYTGDGLPEPQIDYSPELVPREPAPNTVPGLAEVGPGEPAPLPEQTLQESGTQASGTEPCR
eukprot:3564596-Amphidinium_carterae.1